MILNYDIAENEINSSEYTKCIKWNFKGCISEANMHFQKNEPLSLNDLMKEFMLTRGG